MVTLTSLLGQVIARPAALLAAEPLHTRIDASIAAGHPGSVGELASDAEFIRRIYLDLHGTVPTTTQVRSFLADESADKRSKVVDQLLVDPRFSRFMATTFDVMMMERQADKHIKTCFQGIIRLNKFQFCRTSIKKFCVNIIKFFINFFKSF